MTRPLLPPRGLFVPTWILYDRSYPPAQAHTRLQLRGRAWGRSETPELSMAQLSALTGKSPSTLYGHLALLRSKAALRWRPSRQGTFIVAFDQGQDFAPDSKKPEAPALSPPGMDRDESKQESAERAFQKSGAAGEEPPPASPAGVYQSVTRLRPNLAQRRLLETQVRDLELWRRSLEHWLSHRWNPRNLPGQLDLYRRGGPDFCRFCRPPQAASPQEAIDQLILELRQQETEPPPDDLAG
jgi:hypothetical protein